MFINFKLLKPLAVAFILESCNEKEIFPPLNVDSNQIKFESIHGSLDEDGKLQMKFPLNKS